MEMHGIKKDETAKTQNAAANQRSLQKFIEHGLGEDMDLLKR